MAKQTLGPELSVAAIRQAVKVSGKSWSVVERAYRKWEVNAKPVPCKYGAKEQKFAVDCWCEGCTEKMIRIYFDNVLQRLGAF